MTRTWSLELSCTTLAITEAWACRMEPGGRVAKPTVCAAAVPAAANAASTAAERKRFNISLSPRKKPRSIDADAERLDERHPEGLVAADDVAHLVGRGRKHFHAGVG